MSEEISKIEEELTELKNRMETLEGLMVKKEKEMTIEEKITSLFVGQKEMPRVEGYDVWSIMLVKKEGTFEMKAGCYAGGSDYSRVQDLSPEDAANLAGALSHPARIMVLTEIFKSSQYPSDLEQRISSKYGALYHHLNSLVEADLISQEKERGKYIATPAGKAALMFLNVLASIIDTVKYEKPAEKTPEQVTTK